MRGFAKINHLRNGENSFSFMDVGKSCQTWDFLTWKICLLMLFVKIKNKSLMKISEFTVFKCIARMLKGIIHTFFQMRLL